MKKQLMIGLCTIAVLGGLGYSASKKSNAETTIANKPKVFFTKDISPEGLVKIYKKINGNIDGKVAIKWHSGEPHGPNIIPRDMVKALQQSIPNSTLVETNTLYRGGRDTTEKHRETLKINGWDFCDVDIMDEDGTTMLPVKDGKHFTEMSMGKNILNYDSMVVLTHFKGHAMGGFGGSIKNIAIGNVDGQVGKRMVHGATKTSDFAANGTLLMELMVESAKATTDHFKDKIVFINVLRNMSVDCDCAGTSAAPPKASDIGILASTDILAVDQASIDMVYQLPEHEGHDLKERIETREGLHQLDYAEQMKIGTKDYELINLDEGQK